MLDRKEGDQGRRLLTAWAALKAAAPIGPIRTEKQHRLMLDLLEYLQSQNDRRRTNDVMDLVEIIAGLIEDYESVQYPIPETEPREVLRFLMEQHGLKQTDLKSELGSQGVVSEILNGKREINGRQAKALAKRFGVSVGLFL